MAFYESSVTYQKIKSDLLQNVHIVRQRINPKAYQFDLGVSSVPVREALIRLGAEDFIDIIPGKGFFTKGIDINQTQEVLALLNQNLEMLLAYVLKTNSVSSCRQLARYIERQSGKLGTTASIAEKSLLLQYCFRMIAGETKCRESFNFVRRLTTSLHIPLANMLDSPDIEETCATYLLEMSLAIGAPRHQECLAKLNALFDCLDTRFLELADAMAEPKEDLWIAHY